jgi:hypothetical protein
MRRRFVSLDGLIQMLRSKLNCDHRALRNLAYPMLAVRGVNGLDSSAIPLHSAWLNVLSISEKGAR